MFQPSHGTMSRSIPSGTFPKSVVTYARYEYLGHTELEDFESTGCPILSFLTAQWSWSRKDWASLFHEPPKRSASRLSHAQFSIHFLQGIFTKHC